MDQCENIFFINIINKIIKKYEISSFLIAISGGQDSIFLIKLIETFRKYESIIQKIEYIYIDHQWKKESEKQVEYLINYLKPKKAISIYQIKKTTISENQSRIYRYHAIINHAIRYNYEAIITAHTNTDKIETFLQNVTRGTSLEGATSLNIQRKINKTVHIFRPLIYKNRHEIIFLCRKYLLPIWSDATNYNYNIKRNRIRNEIIPYLTKYINKKFENNLNHFIRNCYYDHEFIKQEIIKKYIKIKHTKYIALDYALIQYEHIVIKTKILQLFIYHNFRIYANLEIIKKLIKHINFNTKNIKHQFLWQSLKFNIYKKWIYITI
uniref:tRNA(Ile)-lysidine synthase, chloroplastic n=1 Tax=Dipterocladia arabiensis TaxID=2007176 RepID=A0A1Z1M047_9FLOR|nr:tRNA Ile-lysidine synthetase [Dipterocladia arabiensis]ARW59327.1 tRNA Ile-lysidine synthetase [Dipterocladia arabiensis]